MHSDLVCFSFHPRKILTTGDGGMIATNSKVIRDRLKLLRQHGMSINDRVRHESKSVVFEEHLEVGYNYRLTDIQASVGIMQLEKLETILTERRKIAFQYHNAFKDLSCVDLPIELPDCYSNYQSYCINIKSNSPLTRDELMQEFLNVGISSRRGVMNSHREPAYSNAVKVDLPVSEKLHDNGIVIPLYCPMPQDEINYVIENLLTLLSNK